MNMYAESSQFIASQMLEHWYDHYRCSTSGAYQENTIRLGKGIYDYDPVRTFNSSFEPQHALFEHQCLVWWVTHMLHEQDIPSGIDISYETYADLLIDKLTSITEGTGGWKPNKKRPIHAWGGLTVYSLKKTDKVFTVLGEYEDDTEMKALFRVGETFYYEDTVNPDNSGTYSVVNVGYKGDIPVPSGSIQAGYYYKVVGTIVYNNMIFTGDIFHGISGVTTYTGSGTAYLHATEIAVAETCSVKTESSSAGVGSIQFRENGAHTNTIAYFLTLIDEDDLDDQYKNVKDYLSRFRITDRTNDEIVGYKPYLDEIQDYYFDDNETYTNGSIQPWSDLTYHDASESVSIEHSFAVALGYASIDDWHNWLRDIDALLKGRVYAENGYAHTNYEGRRYEYNFVKYDTEIKHAQYNPILYFSLQTWGALSDTAMAVISQYPNNFMGVSNASMELSGRSDSNEVRGMLEMDGYLYVVCGNIVIRYDSSFDWSLVSGTVMVTSTGPVTMDGNGVYLMICDGTDALAYVYTVSDSTWTAINETDHGFLGGGSVTVLDNFFLSHKPNTSQVYWTLTPLSWDALDYSEAEGKPGNINRIISDNEQIIVLKSNSVELFYNTSDALLTFTRIPNGILESSCIAPHSVVKLDNTVFWLDKDGNLVRLYGATPIIKTLPAIAFKFQQYSTLSDAVAFGYTKSGRRWYEITFPTENKTWIYEVKLETEIGIPGWYERSSYQETVDEDGRHRSNCYGKFQNYDITGDYDTGGIYKLLDDCYTDNEQRIVRERIAPVIEDRNDRGNFSLDAIELLFESGGGLNTGQGSDPKAMLTISRDYGRTWLPFRMVSVGKIGDFTRRAIWRRLGSGRNAVIRLRISDPIKWVITDATINPRD